MKTFQQIIPNLNAGETWWLIKATPTAYIRERNGECARTADRKQALAFPSEEEAVAFVQNASVDDRNARAFGRNCGVCPIANKKP